MFFTHFLSFCDSLFARLTGLTCHLYIASNILPFPARRVNKTQNFQLDNQKNMKFKTKTITTFSQERFQYLYKGCCQQWLMKKTFHRCASCMPIVRNTCSQGGRTWQPFVGSKNGNENFRQAHIYNFRIKCVVFARNRKFAKLLSEICNIYHVIEHFLPKKCCF